MSASLPMTTQILRQRGLSRAWTRTQSVTSNLCQKSTLCASKRTIAALDHLRGGGGEKQFLPLPHPASLSDVEITLRDLIETITGRGPRATSLKNSETESVKMVGRGKIELPAPLQVGRLRRPSTTRETRSLGCSPRATETIQKSAGCVGCVHQFAASDQESRKGRALPWRVWPHVDGGCTEGALGPGCRSRAPLGVPRTESSVPCYVAAAPELFIELSRTERSKLKAQDQRGSKGFCGCRSRARLRLPRTCHSCEVSTRASSLANDK